MTPKSYPDKSIGMQRYKNQSVHQRKRHRNYKITYYILHKGFYGMNFWGKR